MKNLFFVATFFLAGFVFGQDVCSCSNGNGSASADCAHGCGCDNYDGVCSCTCYKAKPSTGKEDQVLALHDHSEDHDSHKLDNCGIISTKTFNAKYIKKHNSNTGVYEKSILFRERIKALEATSI